MIKALLFDLDGTLLHTLPDIRLAINQALRECGYDYSFSLKEATHLIGDGTDMLVRRALKEKSGDIDAFSELKAHYMNYYRAWQDNHAKPFNGLPEVLKVLSDHGIKLYVVTNKPDALANVIVPAHFGKDLFEGIYGIKEGDPVKPDPSKCLEILSREGYQKEEVLYVGDSKPDVDTAENAGIPSVLCLWGYGFYKKDLLERADYVIKKPKELAQLVLWEKKPTGGEG
ncbi:MAG: HAD family hydrolase [Bacilli bacterium]|nr:HAD family hydrolase [Bacilli bacterium]